MDIDFTVQIWNEGGQYIAHAMPLDVSSSGPTPSAARAALDEAVKLFLETAQEHGTLPEALEESGYVRTAAGWHAPDCVCFERHSTAIAV